MFSCALCACSNDLSALYTHADASRQPGRHSDAGDAAKPGDILSLYADLGQNGACLACMKNECADAERACLEDATCAIQARCEARCRDPACMMECPRRIVGTSLFDGDPRNGPGDAGGIARLPYAGGPETPSGCRRRACAAPCEVGRVLDCVGNFEWGRGAVPPVRATLIAAVFLGSSAPPSSIAAHYCNGTRPECDDSSAVTLEPIIAAGIFPSASSGELIFGPQTIELPLGLTSGFFFELDAEGLDPQLEYPLVDPIDVNPLAECRIASPDVYASGFTSTGEMDDPSKGFLLMYTFDCMLDLAPDLSLSVSPPSKNPAISYDYPPRVGDRTTSSGIGYIGRADPGHVDVRATHADTKQVVARKLVWARAAARTTVDLAPRSASEPP